MDFENMSVRELQDKLLELGVAADEAESVKSKANLVTMVKNLMAKDAVSKGEGKRVDSLEEKPNPSEEKAVNRNWVNKADRMRKILEAQEKVSIIIPCDPNEKPGVVETRTDKYGRNYQVKISGSVETPTLNGCKWMVPKGKYVQVPRQIAEVLATSQRQTMEAGQDKLLDRIDSKTGRPMSEILS